MKTIKRLVAALLLLCLAVGLSGCGGGKDLKDTVLDRYNDVLQLVSKHALTLESKFQGKKISGKDAYVGSYTAEYENFDGEEWIFGGTGLERDGGVELTVTYTLRIDSGEASVIWDHSGSQYTLTNSKGESTHEITLGTGDNYIVLKGDNFTGSFDLEVK